MQGEWCWRTRPVAAHSKSSSWLCLCDDRFHADGVKATYTKVLLSSDETLAVSYTPRDAAALPIACTVALWNVIEGQRTPFCFTFSRHGTPFCFTFSRHGTPFCFTFSFLLHLFPAWTYIGSWAFSPRP